MIAILAFYLFAAMTIAFVGVGVTVLVGGLTASPSPAPPELSSPGGHAPFIVILLAFPVAMALATGVADKARRFRLLLDAYGVHCSTGSACSAGVAEPSHVLLAMGATAAEARSSLRFSLGHSSTRADVRELCAAIGPVVERARSVRPAVRQS